MKMNHKYSPVYFKLSEFLSKCKYHDVNFDIAKTLMDKIDEFPSITIDEIAFLANTTAPTVTKFVKKLGYSSFKTFRYDIEPYSTAKKEVNKNIQEFIYNDHLMTVEFFNQLDLETLSKMLDEIIKCETIIILSSSYSFAFTDQLKSIFEKHQKNTYVLNRNSDIQLFQYLMNSSCAVIVISLSGRWIIEHNSLINELKNDEILYYLICPKHKILDDDRVFPWVGMELFSSYYHSNRYLALLGKAIEYLIEEKFPKLESDSF